MDRISQFYQMLRKFVNTKQNFKTDLECRVYLAKCAKLYDIEKNITILTSSEIITDRMKKYIQEILDEAEKILKSN